MISTVTPEKLVEAIFSNEGPRDGWYCMEPGGTWTKILCAGANPPLFPIKDKVNQFITSCGLPQATTVVREEYDDNLKSYLILTVSQEEYQEKIVEVMSSPERLSTITNLARVALGIGNLIER